MGRLPLALLLVAFLALTALYNATIPLGEAPDEPGHLAYALFLAHTRRLPNQLPLPGEVPGEGHQPPLAYLLAAPALAWLPPDDHELGLRANPSFLWRGGSEPGAFMRASREFWPWQGVVLAWHLARLPSALAGAATVFFTWLAARRIADNEGWQHHDHLPLLAAALIAFNPQFLFVASVVSNDALLAALAAALLWRCLPSGAHTTSPASGNATAQQVVAILTRSLQMGALFGAALLTKQSALLLAPLLLWASWRDTQGSWRRFTLAIATWATIALLLAGWWFARNWQLYGDPLGLAVFKLEFTTQAFDWRELAAWRAALGQLFASYWARFGWMSLRPPAWVPWLYAALCALALLGWLGRLPRRADAEHVAARTATAQRSGCSGSPWFGVVLLAALALGWTTSFALTAGLVAWQGRFLFPAANAYALLLGAGLSRRGHTLPARLIRMLPTALFGLACALPLLLIAPAYPRRVLPPAVAQANLGTPLYARFADSWERGVELRGWQIEGRAAPGATLKLTLTWHALEPIPQPWTVFVHLIDSQNTIVTDVDSMPQRGGLPFTRWNRGDWVADEHELRLPAGLAPGSYRLRVGLFQPEASGYRQGIWAEDGSFVGDEYVLGALIIP